MPQDKEPNGWNEWSKFVLKELERLNTCYEGILESVNGLKIKVNTLEVKLAILGGAGGFAAGIIASLAIHFLTK